MRLFCILFIFLCAVPAREPAFSKKYFIVWNIGQGQWTTLVDQDHCLHFDMGGEFFPKNQIEQVCGEKKNFVFLSHWDWDHVGLLKKAPGFLKQLCLARGPLGKASKRKESLLPPPCTELPVLNWQWQPLLNPSKSQKNNDLSQVFLIKNFLIPGDSPQKAEKTWARLLPSSPVRVLVLGHHGSRTSTSEFLLEHLPRLRMAISSARWAKYRHPHAETVARLQKFKVPLLRTEDWGSLWFEL